MELRTKVKRRLTAVLVATALLGGASTAMADTSTWQVYYENWFKTKNKCIGQGNWVIGAPPYAHPGIQGIDAYSCFKGLGDPKWSMKVHWYGRWATVEGS